MSLPEQIARWMSLRQPQHESLKRLHAVAEAVESGGGCLRILFAPG